MQKIQENINDPDFTYKYLSYQYDDLTLPEVIDEVLSYSPPKRNLNHEELITLIEKIIHRTVNDREYGKLINTLEANISDPNVTDYFQIKGISPEQILEKALTYQPIRLPASSE